MGWFSNLFKRKKLSAAKVENLGPITGSDGNTVSETITKGMVIPNKLNARQSPTKSAKILYKLKKHTVVQLLGQVDSDWLKIKTELGEAYVMKEYIQLQEVIEKVLVNVKVLNVRSYYSTDATILGKVYQGNILVKLSKHFNWFGIDYNGQTGYVSADYVTLLSDGKSDTTSNKSTTSTTTTKNNDTTRVFFNSRDDLAKVELAPKKLLSSDGLDKYGKVAVKCWNNYGNLVSVISNELGIDVERALAVICVESGGNGFAADGKMLIRFENHVFHSYWGSKSDENQKLFDEHFSFNAKSRRNDHKYRANKKDEWKTGHANQAAEWEALEIARKLNETIALSSISMGAPQVMGFNYKMIGYNSVKEMFDAFNKDIRYHIMALFDFCTAKSSRVQYLITGDFLSFAKEYNGLTAPESYEERLIQYYDIYTKILK